MIRKILLLVLVAVFIVLTLALFNQYERLPNQDAAELEPTAQGARDLARSWTTPGQDPSASEAGSQDPVAEDEAANSGQEQPEPDAQQDSSDAQQDSAHAPLVEYGEDPAEMSKTEKALRRGGGWIMEQGEKADELAQDVEQELDQETQVKQKMQITGKDQAAPERRTNTMVDEIEQKALAKVQGENAPAPTPPAVAQQKTETIQQKPATKGQKPAKYTSVNSVSRLELTSDPSGVTITIVATKPIGKYEYFQIKQPKRFVLDMHGVFSRSTPEVKSSSNAIVKDLRTGLHTSKLRVVADLKEGPEVTASVEKRSDKEIVVILRAKQ